MGTAVLHKDNSSTGCNSVCIELETFCVKELELELHPVTWETNADLDLLMSTPLKNSVQLKFWIRKKKGMI